MAGFEIVNDEAAEVVRHPSSLAQPDKAKLDVQLLSLALKSISQRALIALSNCFTGLGLLSAWLLWRTVLPDPTTLQLTGLGGYAVFLLCLEVVRRR